MLPSAAAFSENLDPIIIRLEPAFVENVGQAPTAYTHALNPSGFLFNCTGLGSAGFRSFTTIPADRRLEIAGARPACVAAPGDPAGDERFYPTGSTAHRFRRLRFLQVLDGVDVEYSVVNERLELAFLSPDAAKLSAITLKSAGEFPWEPPTPLDSPGRRVFRFEELPVLTSVLGGSLAEVDAVGNWHVLSTESTWSAMAPDAATCLRGLAPYPCPDVTLLSFSADGALRFMTHLRGRRYDQATALAVDAEGNPYVAGTTYSADFPVTQDPLQPGYAGPEEMRQESRVYPGGDVFIAKLSGKSGELIYSKMLGSPLPDTATSLGVDSSGAVFIGIRSHSRDFPATENAPFTPSCLQTPFASQWCGWLASVDQSGARLRYSTPIPALYPDVAVSPDGKAAFAGEASGRIVPIHVLSPGGVLLPGDFQLPLDYLRSLRWAPDGALWTTGARTSGPLPQDAHLARIDPLRGEVRLISIPTPIEDFAIHPDGSFSALVYGGLVQPANPWLPAPGAMLESPCKSSALLARLDLNGGFLRSTFIPGSSHSLVAATEGVVFWQSPYLDSGAQTPLSRLDWNAPPGLRLLCAHNPGHPATELFASGGAIMELRGPGIGSATPVELPRGPDGRLPDEYAGNRATIAGQPAKVLAAGPGSLTVILPQALKSSQEQIILWRGSDVAGVLNVSTGAAMPLAVSGILGLRPTNSTGVANSQAAPAASGDVVTVHISGTGLLNPPLPDGEIEHATLSAPSIALAAEMVGRPCEIISAHQAPNLPSGILEVQVRLPALSNANPGVHAFDLVVGRAPEPWYFSSARFLIFLRVPGQ